MKMFLEEIATLVLLFGIGYLTILFIFTLI